MGIETDAEKAYERLLQSKGYMTDRARPTYGFRGGKTFSTRNDFFGCVDVMGIHPGNWPTYAQVTTGGYEAQRQRKRKLEAVAWNPECHVILVVAFKERDPLDKRRKRWRFEIDILDDERTGWLKLEPEFIGLS